MRFRIKNLMFPALTVPPVLTCQSSKNFFQTDKKRWAFILNFMVETVVQIYVR
jgi:hypothetical protein